MFRKGATHKLKPSPSDITAIGLSDSVVGPQNHHVTVEAHSPDNSTVPVQTPISMNCAIAAKNTVAVYPTRSHTKPTDIDTWHHHLGHVNYQVTGQMHCDVIVQGLDITTHVPTPGACEDWIMGKHTQHPVHSNDHREAVIGECTYIDLWGPSHVKSARGKLYMMLVVDGFSGLAKGYFLADKQASTTLEALKQNIALSERQTGQKIKCIQTDKGTEFCNSSWHDFLTSHGIIHETTSAHSSASNGVVECTHHMIIECVHVLLHETGLSASMWCEVASMIIYLS